VELIEAAGRAALVTGATGGSAGVAGVDVPFFNDTAATEILGIQADCTDETAVRDAVAATLDRFKRIDYLVHAVGVVGPGKFMDIDLAHWRRILDLNLTSAFLVCQAAYPHLKAAKGSAVLIASSNALTGGDWVSGPVYAIAKGGIVQMTRYLSREWMPDGIRVNCVAPGPVDTPMLDRLTEKDHADLKAQIPVGRYATPEEVAAAIGFLCSEHSASTTGTVSNITGGRIVD
jgi:NAD(P)-dependent dehydrogenase (short-subunit alcohol dehydrogenase family)